MGKKYDNSVSIAFLKIDIDSDGSILIAGAYQGLLTQKYDTNGNLVWAKREYLQYGLAWMEPKAIFADSQKRITVVNMAGFAYWP